MLHRKQDWKWCQNSMNDPGSEGISNRIINFDIVDLHPEVAARSKEILQKYRLDDVRNENEAAAIYYQWVSCYYHILGTATIRRSFTDTSLTKNNKRNEMQKFSTSAHIYVSDKKLIISSLLN